MNERPQSAQAREIAEDAFAESVSLEEAMVIRAAREARPEAVANRACGIAARVAQGYNINFRSCR